jgi:hypothetical protein
MYELIRSASTRQGLTIREIVAGGLALVTTEAFYKFHSFTLEAVAFVATWFVLSWLAKVLIAPGPR